MRYLKVGAAALNQTPLDWKGNLARIRQAIAQARGQGVQVLCLPELCISGYGCEDAFHGESVAQQALEALLELAPDTRGIAVAVGLPVLHGRGLFNAAALLVDGRLAGLAAKKVLAGYGVYYEPRWFKAWPVGVAEVLRANGQDVPIGDLVFDLGGVRVGFEICEDAWGRGQLTASQAVQQADLLLNPSASHFAFAKYATLRGIVAEGSRLGHAAYVFANLLGNESGRLIFDGATFIASDGRILAEGRRFSYQELELLTSLVDVRALRLERRRLTYPLPAGDGTRQVVTIPFTYPQPQESEVRALRAAQAVPAEAAPDALPPQARMSRNEEFAHAVSLGLWDYLRKSKSQGLAVSLSGGVDSSTVAVLGWMMVHRALTELGWPAFKQRLAHCPDLPNQPVAAQASNPADADPQGADQREADHQEARRALVKRLLLTVYQSTANSSATTRNAARGLAEFLGSQHVELDVQPLVEGYERLAQEALGRPLTWELDDLARQNIQARVRSPGIWLLVNLRGMLLLCTSNRSEVATGYATMDGDTSGGLAPIAGANKTFLRGWLRWLERQGCDGLGPIPVLSQVNDQAPTAELRPLSAKQEDERDLMPYPVLDVIEQAAIRDRLPPLEVWEVLRTCNFPGLKLEPRQAADWVARFFKLWSRSQWKRERLAPSFHLDDENLDPRTWCRFPILQGGYVQELEALERAVMGNTGSGSAGSGASGLGSTGLRNTEVAKFPADKAAGAQEEPLRGSRGRGKAGG